MKRMQSEKKVLSIVFIIYLVCFVFRLFEYFVLRTDKTMLGEAVVHKLIGIGILFVASKVLLISAKEIGYSKENTLSNLLKGLCFGFVMFVIAYGVEIVIALSQGRFQSLQMYVSAYAVDKNVGHQTALPFSLICILGNVINVIMEEGIFRGLFMKILQRRYCFFSSAIITSILFGAWHVVRPIRNYCDGISSLGGMIANIIMLVRYLQKCYRKN